MTNIVTIAGIASGIAGPIPIAVDSSGRLIGGGSGGAAPPTGDNAVNTGTSTQVSSVTTAGGVTILAANTARYGASVANDDANALYLLLGAGTVSSTVYTVKLYTDDVYEVPYGFTGVLTGVWAGDGSGAARVTEYT